MDFINLNDTYLANIEQDMVSWKKSILKSFSFWTLSICIIYMHICQETGNYLLASEYMK